MVRRPFTGGLTMLDTLLAYPQSWFGPFWPALWTLVKIVVIVVPLMLSVAYLTL
jgi:NADH-quinone oxidoreductase subunit H